MSEAVKINCPHCGKKVKFKRDTAGRWVGTVAGGGIGYFILGGLGLAGGILGAPVAIPATLVGVAVVAGAGNRIGKAIDDRNAKCPSCGKSMVL